jgi:flagellar basal-body rod protein FlgB
VLNGIFGPQLNNLQRALGKTTERQGMLANNIANINTPGYKRQDTDFNIVLDEQMQNGGLQGSTGFQQMQQQQQQHASDKTSIRVDGNNVDMEREVENMAETELRFQALSDLTATYFSNLKSAIHEGR